MPGSENKCRWRNVEKRRGNNWLGQYETDIRKTTISSPAAKMELGPKIAATPAPTMSQTIVYSRWHVYWAARDHQPIIVEEQTLKVKIEKCERKIFRSKESKIFVYKYCGSLFVIITLAKRYEVYILILYGIWKINYNYWFNDVTVVYIMIYRASTFSVNFSIYNWLFPAQSFWFNLIHLTHTKITNHFNTIDSCLLMLWVACGFGNVPIFSVTKLSHSVTFRTMGRSSKRLSWVFMRLTAEWNAIIDSWSLVWNMAPVIKGLGLKYSEPGNDHRI